MVTKRKVSISYKKKYKEVSEDLRFITKINLTQLFITNILTLYVCVCVFLMKNNTDCFTRQYFLNRVFPISMNIHNIEACFCVVEDISSQVRKHLLTEMIRRNQEIITY